MSLQTHIKVDRSPGQVWVVNFSAQPVEVRVVCEVFCCQESQLDWPVDSTRTETRRLQSLLLGTRRLQLQSLLLLGARRLQSLLLLWTRRLLCLLLLGATRAPSLLLGDRRQVLCVPSDWWQTTAVTVARNKFLFIMYNLFIFFYLYFCYSCKFIFL